MLNRLVDSETPTDEHLASDDTVHGLDYDILVVACIEVRNLNAVKLLGQRTGSTTGAATSGSCTELGF